MTPRILKIHRFIFGTLCAAGLLASCGAPSGANTKVEESLEAGQNPLKEDSSLTADRHSQAADSVKLRWENGDSVLIAIVAAIDLPTSFDLEVGKSYQQIHLVIQGLAADSLQAKLSFKQEDRNLRFNQIVLPDGTMDGPFGNELMYSTKEKGDYTLIIGKDNMADGNVEGPVSIEIALTK